MVQRAFQAEIVGGWLCVPAGECVEHTQYTTRPTRRCNRRFAVTAAQGTHAVTATLRRPRGDGARACRLHRLESHAGAEIQRRRRIGHDQADPLAFGLEKLGMGTAGPRGHAPVDMPCIITGHVLA